MRTLKAFRVLLAGLLLFSLFLMLSTAPGGLGRSFLTRAGHAGYVPITGLGVLGVLDGRLGFLGAAAFLLFARVLGFRNTLLRRTPTGCTLLRWRNKSGQPATFLDVFFHLLSRRSYDTEIGATSEARVVMCADNMVEICRIVLDGIRAKWTAWHACAGPILGVSRLVDVNSGKRLSRMQLLQQTQSSSSPTWENHEDMPPWRRTGKEH